MTQREEWVHALHQHQREVERLSRAIGALVEAGGQPLEPSPEREERTRRQIEYSTAEMIRHQISMALLSSRIASPLS